MKQLTKRQLLITGLLFNWETNLNYSPLLMTRDAFTELTQLDIYPTSAFCSLGPFLDNVSYCCGTFYSSTGIQIWSQQESKKPARVGFKVKRTKCRVQGIEVVYLSTRLVSLQQTILWRKIVHPGQKNANLSRRNQRTAKNSPIISMRWRKVCFENVFTSLIIHYHYDKLNFCLWL